ncbi:MAG: hypothetical protein ACI4T1_04190 [Christensenellales bacterium]
MEKVEYKRCPRCELNYIPKKDKLCKICQAEVDSLGKPDAFAEMQICPICKVNYISEGEDMCEYCAEEQRYENAMGGELDRDESWRMYVENDDADSEEEEYGELDAINSTSDEETDNSEIELEELDDTDVIDDEDLDELDDLEDISDLEEDDFDEEFDDEEDDEDEEFDDDDTF